MLVSQKEASRNEKPTWVVWGREESVWVVCSGLWESTGIRTQFCVSSFLCESELALQCCWVRFWTPNGQSSGAVGKLCQGEGVDLVVVMGGILVSPLTILFSTDTE